MFVSLKVNIENKCQTFVNKMKDIGMWKTGDSDSNSKTTEQCNLSITSLFTWFPWYQWSCT